MATVDSDIEQAFLERVEKAITETASLFLKNPWQFHGDTGIMHYLYHRMLCNGEERLFQRSAHAAVDTLLFQSEVYTQEMYLHKGKKNSPGKLDLALLDPGSITSIGRVRRRELRLPEIAGIEVGLGKSVDKMGDMAAEQTARSVLPGDAAKLIRAIRFGSMRHGFLLEFYRKPGSGRDARRVFNAVLAAADGLAGFHVLVLVAGNGNTLPKASVYPDEWKAKIGLERYTEIELEANVNQDVDLPSFERFQICIQVDNALCRFDRTAAAEFLDSCLAEQGTTGGNLTIIPVDRALLSRGLGLYRSTPDKDWGLTDCISFVVMRENRLVDAMTADRHFTQAGFRAMMLEES